MRELQAGAVTRISSIELAELGDTVRSVRQRRQLASASSDFLMRRTEGMPSSLDELLEAAYQEGQRGSSNEILHHVEVVVNALSEVLWSRRYFIGQRVIADLVVDFLHRRTEPIAAVLEWAVTSQATRPGLLLFPLHSLGVLGAGLFALSKDDERVSFVNETYGYALTPQTNRIERTTQFLELVKQSFGVEGAIPLDLLEHWRRSRRTTWLETNPILVVQMVRAPASYYDSHWLVVLKVQEIAGLIAMLSALQPRREGRTARMMSSSVINNFETLDLHHYISLYRDRRGELIGDCVPIHGNQRFVLELTDLAVELDPRYWDSEPDLRAAVHDAVNVVYQAELDATFKTKLHPRMALARTMFRSMGFFRRSLGSANRWSEVVALSTALELLLLDNRGPIRQDLGRRALQLLTHDVSTSTAKRMADAVQETYMVRNELVHAGVEQSHFDCRDAREAYVRCFVALAQRLQFVTQRSASPIEDISNRAL